MKIIAHRGNISGPSTMENHPDYIQQALNAGFDVELDVWNIDSKLVLGHDNPQYEINLEWLYSHKDCLWIHLKNIECYQLFKNTNLNYFWHENDKFTLTSKNIPWCYPSIYISNGVTVLCKEKEIPDGLYGICTDYAIEWKTRLK
jgi:hypothetical protein